MAIQSSLSIDLSLISSSHFISQHPTQCPGNRENTIENCCQPPGFLE